jgi:hypothetical protein
MRKQMFITVNGMNLHLCRFKNAWKITCFDVLDKVLGISRRKQYDIICKYLEAEGFIKEGESILITSNEFDEDWM